MADDKPWFPYVQCDDTARHPVMWGKGGWIFILAICGVLASASLMTYRVNASEEQDAVTEQNIKILGENQQKLDEAQRIQTSQTGLMVDQLNALLDKADVDRIAAPKVEESRLKELK
jgi:hypothetical protein